MNLWAEVTVENCSTLRPLSHIPGCEAGWPRMAGPAPSGIIPYAPYRSRLDVRLYPWPSGLVKKEMNMFNFWSRCSRMKKTPGATGEPPWSHRNGPAVPYGDRGHPAVEISWRRSRRMPVPARIEHGGYTDTPGLSPAISRCIYGPLQDVSEYSRFLHGGATDVTVCSR